MANFSDIIFDLDGTLVDSKPGLLNALIFVLDQMGIDMDAEEVIDQLIGPPIQQGMKEILQFTPPQIEVSARLFREYYGQRGMFEGEVYPGMLILLEELKSQGCRLYVATSKQKAYISGILQHFDLDQYFDDVEAADGKELQTKAELITLLMDRNRISPSHQVVMIGDTKFDVVGGKANQISTVAVGYGFGENEELLSLTPDYFAEDVDELTEILLG